MKNSKILLSLLFIAFISAFTAQNKGNCYIDYVSSFKERGASKVTDGVQNVVVTSRNSDGTTCSSMVGTIEVKKGKITRTLLLKAVNGEMVKPSDTLHENYFVEGGNMKADYAIKNGMSSTFLTQKKDLVNIFFVDFLKTATPGLKEAPKAK